MLYLLYIPLFLVLHILYQRTVGTAQNKIYVILARDAGAFGLLAMIAFFAGIFGLHERHDFLIYIAMYLNAISIASFIMVKRKDRRARRSAN